MLRLRTLIILPLGPSDMGVNIIGQNLAANDELRVYVLCNYVQSAFLTA